MTPRALLEAASAPGARLDLSALAAMIPYAQLIGVKVDLRGTEMTAILPFAPHLIGNPVLPALHGGVVGGFLEVTALLQTVFELRPRAMPKPVDISIDYLRSGRPVDTFARAVIAKQGRRVVNIHAQCWQEEHHRPIAALRGHFLLPESAAA